MAVLTFNDVYRSGAATGSPVAAYYVADTQAELLVISGIQGDLGFSKNNNTVWACYGGTSWAPIFNGGTIYNDLIINKTTPLIALAHPGIAPIARMINVNGQLMLTTNCYYASSRWWLDDTSLKGNVIVLGFTDTAFYSITSDGNSHLAAKIDNVLGNISAIANFYESNRATALGKFIAVNPTSNYFFCPGGMIFTPSGTATQSVYKYNLIGDMITLNIFVNGIISGTLTNQINIYTPQALFFGINYEVAAASVNNSGLFPCRVYSVPNQAYVTFEKLSSNFIAGSCDICIQMAFQFYQ